MKSGKTAECSFNECVPSFLLVISGKDGFFKGTIGCKLCMSIDWFVEIFSNFAFRFS